MREHVVYKDGTFPGLLLLGDRTRDAVARVCGGILRQPGDRKRTLVPVLRAFDSVGSTAGVAFDTTKRPYPTHPDRCDISHVVLDGKLGNDWEAKVAAVLEELPQVRSYAKNDHLGFTIPYTVDGVQRSYVPDFLVSARVPDGEPALTLVVEVTGRRDRDKEEKVRTARDLWVPAVTAHGRFGQWGFVEVRDPWDCRADLTAALAVP